MQIHQNIFFVHEVTQNDVQLCVSIVARLAIPFLSMDMHIKCLQSASKLYRHTTRGDLRSRSNNTSTANDEKPSHLVRASLNNSILAVK